MSQNCHTEHTRNSLPFSAHIICKRSYIPIFLESARFSTTAQHFRPQIYICSIFDDSPTFPYSNIPRDFWQRPSISELKDFLGVLNFSIFWWWRKISELKDAFKGVLNFWNFWWWRKISEVKDSWGCLQLVPNIYDFVESTGYDDNVQYGTGRTQIAHYRDISRYVSR